MNQNQLADPQANPDARLHPAQPKDNGHADGNGHGNGDKNGHQPPHDHDQIDLNIPHPPAMWIFAIGIIAVLAMAALLVVGIIPRLRTHKELSADAEAAAHAPVPVNIVTPRRADAVLNVPLPGTLRPGRKFLSFPEPPGT